MQFFPRNAPYSITLDVPIKSQPRKLPYAVTVNPDGKVYAHCMDHGFYGDYLGIIHNESIRAYIAATCMVNPDNVTITRLFT